MKIAHYNTYASGGSAVLMQRLHEGLLKEGVDSRLRYREGSLDSTDAELVAYTKSGLDRFLERARYSIENRLLKQPPRSYFSRTVFHRSTCLPEFDHDCDLIHLHWVSRWLDLPSFVSSIPAHVPIVWSLHDMSPMAGGCFLDFGCDQYGGGCGTCPLLRPPFDRVLAAKEVRRRREALEGRKVLVVANSESTRELAERSEVFEEFEKVTIQPGLDLDSFSQFPKNTAKEALGIATDSLVLGFGAASLTDPNKGLKRFLSVASNLVKNGVKVSVLLFGDGEPPAESEGFAVHCLGELSSPRDLSRAYSAMDVFVLASEMETFGQVSVEAQACGTPVWAFDVGGVSETLKNDVSGCLFPFPETEFMSASIQKYFQEGELARMGDEAFDFVRTRFSSAMMTEAYLKAYSLII